MHSGVKFKDFIVKVDIHKGGLHCFQATSLSAIYIAVEGRESKRNGNGGFTQLFNLGISLN